MSNVTVNGTTYSGVTSVKLPLSSNNGYATYAEANFQEKTVTENGEVTPDAGYSALSKVVVNVSASSGIQEASGTIALEADQSYLKVTGLPFTPKAFRIVPSNSIQNNSSLGATYVRGSWCGYRTGTNNANAALSGFSVSTTDQTAQSDDYTPTTSGTSVAPYVLEHGFAVAAYNNNFPFRSGMSFSWYAVG